MLLLANLQLPLDIVIHCHFRTPHMYALSNHSDPCFVGHTLLHTTTIQAEVGLPQICSQYLHRSFKYLSDVTTN